MATVNLGRIKFVWQGAYSGATAYVADDVVSYNGSSYICILASTGNLPTNATYWSLMAQSGTDITSLAGLAQGDVLYYNGTSWVRLGAGTSGQYLKTNGTGANPAWATVSSDFVKLYTVTQSSFVSSTVIDGYFDDTIYASYELHISHMRTNSSTSNNQLRMRWYNAGAEQTGSNYRWLLNEMYSGNTSSTTGDNSRAGYDNTSWEQMNGTWSSSNDSTVSQQNYILQIFNPQDTNNAKHVMHNYLVNSSDGSRACGVGYCTFNSTSSMSGLSFYNDNSYTHKARWTLYGKKK